MTLSPPTPTTSPSLDANLERAARQEDAEAAGKAFEELLLGMLMKAMRQTVPASSGGGFARDTVDAMFDEALAQAGAGKLGLAKVFERQLGANPGNAEIIPHQPSFPKTLGPQPSPVASIGPRTRTGVLATSIPQPGDRPVLGPKSSPYGHRIHPITGESRFHAGIDIAAPEGTEIRSVQRGVVTHAGWKRGYGNVVEIRHPDGATSRYAHASRVHVHVGDHVDVGETVADVGSTGQSTGPHLHFEVRRNGHPIDPEAYLKTLRTQSIEAGDKGATTSTGLK